MRPKPFYILPNMWKVIFVLIIFKYKILIKGNLIRFIEIKSQARHVSNYSLTNSFLIKKRWQSWTEPIILNKWSNFIISKGHFTILRLKFDDSSLWWTQVVVTSDFIIIMLWRSWAVFQNTFKWLSFSKRWLAAVCTAVSSKSILFYYFFKIIVILRRLDVSP